MVLKKIVLLLLVLFVCTGVFAQSVIGKWKMVDDENGKARSIVELYEKNGKVYGRILELLNPKKKNAICSKCDDYRKDTKVEGMVVIEDMEKNGDVYDNGQILNPDSGSFYRCKLWLDKDNPDELHVRGYLAFFYRTQIWERIN